MNGQDLTPLQQQVEERIAAYLEAGGFSLGYRDEKGLVDNAPLTDTGLPLGIRVFVAPCYVTEPGDHVIVVTPTMVGRYFRNTPSGDDCTWEQKETTTYKNKEELQKTLAKMLEQPLGCWA